MKEARVTSWKQMTDKAINKRLESIVSFLTCANNRCENTNRHYEFKSGLCSECRSNSVTSSRVERSAESQEIIRNAKAAKEFGAFS